MYLFLAALATNHCYSLTDGQFSQRPELMDAPGCSVARGAPIASLGEFCDLAQFFELRALYSRTLVGTTYMACA